MRYWLLSLLVLAAAPLRAETLRFEGRIEAAREAVLSSQVDGMVTEIMFDSGDYVETGAPLILLDPADAQLSVAIAEAKLAIAVSERDSAASEAERQENLSERGVATVAALEATRTAQQRTEAKLALAKVELRRARLMLERTALRAPITGFIGKPQVDTGAFLEAESGAPLARIVALDPVVVSYRVPYATRLTAMHRTGHIQPSEMFDQILLRFELPGGSPYGHTTRPDHTAATVDPEHGTITVRAYLPNPDQVLRPGMTITVLAEFDPTESLE